MKDSSTRWFRRGRTGTEPELRLVCFPHAGGTPSLFRSWQQYLPDEVELLAACYPGRQERIAEPLIDTMAVLADSAADALEPLLDKPLAVFGHSMGASLAYEVSLRLAERHGVRPLRVFVSGHQPPHCAERTRHHLLDDDGLVAELGRLGASGLEAITDPDLRDLVLPSIRADFKLIETYHAEQPARLDSPVTAFLGEQDENCPPERMRAWSELTSADFELRLFPGGHFYLEPLEAVLVPQIAAHLHDDLRLHRAHRLLAANAARRAQPPTVAAAPAAPAEAGRG
ncbi:thioesterase II family protein [Kitasatospora sp. NPDC054939]